MDKKPEARPGSLEYAHDASLTWRYLAPPGVTLEMCCDRSYWRNVTKECGQARVAGRGAWNKIEIIAEDGSWEADLRIVSVGDGLVATRVLRQWPAEQTAAPVLAPAPDGYTVEHIQGNGWRTLDARNQVLVEKRSSRDEALQAAVRHHDKARAR